MGAEWQQRLAWLVWTAGVLWFAGSGDGIGRAVWAAWTAGGMALLMGRQARDPVTSVAVMTAILVVLGLSWWWALLPQSWLAGSRAYLTALFWGALLGSLAGITVLLRADGRR